MQHVLCPQEDGRLATGVATEYLVKTAVRPLSFVGGFFFLSKLGAWLGWSWIPEIALMALVWLEPGEISVYPPHSRHIVFQYFAIKASVSLGA